MKYCYLFCSNNINSRSVLSAFFSILLFWAANNVLRVTYILCPMRLLKKQMKRKTIRENNKQTNGNVHSVGFFIPVFHSIVIQWMNRFISFPSSSSSSALIHFTDKQMYYIFFSSRSPSIRLTSTKTNIWLFCFFNSDLIVLVQSIICHLFCVTVTALRFVSALIVWKNDMYLVLSCESLVWIAEIATADGRAGLKKINEFNVLLWVKRYILSNYLNFVRFRKLVSVWTMLLILLPIPKR